MIKPVYLFDSVILIDILNTKPQAKKWLSSVQEDRIAISVVTMSEVLVGTKDNEISVVMDALGRLPCLPIVVSTAELAAKLRQQYRFKLLDAYQAALAIEHKLTLVTRNTKDFNPKIHPFVKIPYSL